MTEGKRDKHLLFQAISVMGKAFASPVRLELLDLLAQAPRTVETPARATGQSTANVSQHLQALHAAGMVTRERQGTSVRYEIAGPEALRLWIALRDASIMRLAELPADREIVAYCRGPFCAFAHDAVRRLTSAGRTARRLDEGWPEWRLADEPATEHI